jgi:hypothetical protein
MQPLAFFAWILKHCGRESTRKGVSLSRRGIILYRLYRSTWFIRVFVTSSELGPPPPSPTSEFVAPLGPREGGSNSRFWVRGCMGDPIRTTGKKARKFGYCLLCVIFLWRWAFSCNHPHIKIDPGLIFGCVL